MVRSPQHPSTFGTHTSHFTESLDFYRTLDGLAIGTGTGTGTGSDNHDDSGNAVAPVPVPTDDEVFLKVPVEAGVEGVDLSPIFADPSVLLRNASYTQMARCPDTSPSPGPSPGPGPGPGPVPKCTAQLEKDCADCAAQGIITTCHGSVAQCEKYAESHEPDLKAAGCTTQKVKALCAKATSFTSFTSSRSSISSYVEDNSTLNVQQPATPVSTSSQLACDVRASAQGPKGGCPQTPCNEIPLAKIAYMGYSVRVEGFRYTIWLSYDGALNRSPDWQNASAVVNGNGNSDGFSTTSSDQEQPAGSGTGMWVLGEELYDHKGDDGQDFSQFENVNLLADYDSGSDSGGPASAVGTSSRQETRSTLFGMLRRRFDVPWNPSPPKQQP